jgi:hypothetical protein
MSKIIAEVSNKEVVWTDIRPYLEWMQQPSLKTVGEVLRKNGILSRCLDLEDLKAIQAEKNFYQNSILGMKLNLIAWRGARNGKVPALQVRRKQRDEVLVWLSEEAYVTAWGTYEVLCHK